MHAPDLIVFSWSSPRRISASCRRPSPCFSKSSNSLSVLLLMGLTLAASRKGKHHRTYSTRPSRSGTAPNSAGVRYEALASRPLKATLYHSLNHTDEGSFWCPRQGHGVISGHRPCSLKRRDVLHRLTAWMELKTTRCTEKRRAGERAGRKRTKLLS